MRRYFFEYLYLDVGYIVNFHSLLFWGRNNIKQDRLLTSELFYTSLIC